MLNLFDQNIKDYESLRRINKIPEITIFQFVNFIDNYQFDNNILFNLLSHAIIYSKSLYIQKYKKEDKEKNIIIIDSIVLKAFHEIVYKGLQVKDITSHLNRYINL